MATKRASIVTEIATRLAALALSGNPRFGSVNKDIRPWDAVNDQPSVDVFAANETRDQKPSYMVERTLQVVIRIYAKSGDEDDGALDTLIELVEDQIRSDGTLGNLVIDSRVVAVDTDGGMLAMAGFGSMAEISVECRWEAQED